MKTNLYSIYDSIAEVFNKPFAENTDGSAVRAFKQALAENPNKKDYLLHHVGEWDDNKGTGKFFDVPKRIADNYTNNIAEEDNNEISNEA
jgi:hypothetical protein